jgi:hypothetical protein
MQDAFLISPAVHVEYEIYSVIVPVSAALSLRHVEHLVPLIPEHSNDRP